LGGAFWRTAPEIKAKGRERCVCQRKKADAKGDNEKAKQKKITKESIQESRKKKKSF